ncbi:MAG: hypothetical protein EBU90_00145 [Proteobacteria bacterium]|nr:hypothetical protein [Pseudomonadota bacterium]NBP12842.1 hypothetical protein [bacterium]
MAKNTKLQNNTEEFIESVVEKILQKQAAQGQTSNYLQVLDDNPPSLPVGVLTSNGNYNHGVYGPAPTSVTEYTKKLAEAYADVKKSSPLQDSLNALAENVIITERILSELVNKLAPITNTQCIRQDVPTEVCGQSSYPIINEIERIGNNVYDIRRTIEFLIENIAV